MDEINDENDIQLSQKSDLNDEELMEMEVSAQPDNTKKNTKYGMKKFEDWLLKRGKQCSFATITVEELNDLLRKFYAEVKPSKPGGCLTPSTLTCLRAAIHRHLTSAPYHRTVNIIKDREFLPANNMFTAR